MIKIRSQKVKSCPTQRGWSLAWLTLGWWIKYWGEGRETFFLQGTGVNTGSVKLTSLIILSWKSGGPFSLSHTLRRSSFFQTRRYSVKCQRSVAQTGMVSVVLLASFPAIFLPLLILPVYHMSESSGPLCRSREDLTQFVTVSNTEASLHTAEWNVSTHEGRKQIGHGFYLPVCIFKLWNSKLELKSWFLNGMRTAVRQPDAYAQFTEHIGAYSWWMVGH